ARSDQEVIRPWGRPLYAQGHLAVLRGNLASEGAVAKITGIKHVKMTGPARVFDCEEDSLAAILAGRIKPGDIVVIRYEGPKGGPGMREMLSPTSAIIGAGLGDKVGLITDGRFSGGRTSSAIQAPISRVPIMRSLGRAMSRVRAPCSSAAAIACSTAAAGSASASP